MYSVPIYIWLMNRFASILEFRIAKMGIRILVLLVVVKILAMNTCAIAAWPAVAAVSRWMSGPLAAGQADSKFRPHGHSAFQLDRELWGPNSLRNVQEKRTDNVDWSELILTIQWPETFCLNYNDTHNGSDKCVIPPTIKQWTMHGMWPSSPGSEGPSFCNATWPFNPSNITDIESEMKTSWPSYIISQPYDYLWKHEWEKHGTCAASLPALYGEHDYFKTTLGLYKRYDVYSILKKGGVTPTMEMSYSYEKILGVFKSALGKIPTIACLYDSKTHIVYLSEVEICLDKTFAVIDCSPSKTKTKTLDQQAGPGTGRLREENCAHQNLIFYPPMNGM